MRFRRSRRSPARQVGPLPVSSSLGSVVIDGHRFPVTDIRLRCGGVLISYEVRGPLPPVRGNVTVFGQDDRGCWQGHEVSLPAIRDGDVWAVQYLLTTADVLTWGTTVQF